MMLDLYGVDALRELCGTSLGTTEWHHVDQRTISYFAAVAGDIEQLHLDPEVAAGYGLDSTIAHGLFTLALGAKFLQELYRMEGHSRVLNYG